LDFERLDGLNDQVMGVLLRKFYRFFGVFETEKVSNGLVSLSEAIEELYADGVD
jgi:hypothetical protein